MNKIKRVQGSYQWSQSKLEMYRSNYETDRDHELKVFQHSETQESERNQLDKV